MKKNIIMLVTGIVMLSGCDDLFSPAIDNFKDQEQVNSSSEYAQGMLLNCYRIIPGYYSDTDYATDDAVTNQKGNPYLNMATGNWTAADNPVNFWNQGYNTINVLNRFIANIDNVKWADDEEPARLFRMRVTGEAYGLRALFYYYLLRNHAGITDDGQLMGVPLFTTFLSSDANFNMPRATFSECVRQIISDLDSAEAKLPEEYENINSDSDIPAKYLGITKRKEVYNRVMEQYARQLFNGIIAKAIRSRVTLLAASPAFKGDQQAWGTAADAAAAVIDHVGGVDGLAANGVTYYCNTTEIDALKEGVNPKEILWRENIQTADDSQEQNNYPPSWFGKGMMNPTQNLVDAFPMANGYPISNPKSGYNAEDPYSGRDPRLSKYIFYNGSKGTADDGTGTSHDVAILTGSLSGTDDGINVKETSTRTGYYMKKRLRMDVNCNPSSNMKKPHYIPRVRYTEMFLNYAEAANEAYGPTGRGGHEYSAYDVIKAIRKRAGLAKGQEDAYLEECKDDKDKMRQLIRNERRLELCFESFRFWDLRRWNSTLTETARGMDANAGAYHPFDVEQRAFADYMTFCPIPYSEILKYDALKQNKGWK